MIEVFGVFNEWGIQLNFFFLFTLYTNLDLVLVKDSLFKVIDKDFNSFNKFLCVRFDRTFFSKHKYSSFHCFEKQKLKDAVNFIFMFYFILMYLFVG